MDGRTVLWEWADGLPEGASVGATLAAIRAATIGERADTPGPGEIRALYDAAERKGRPAEFQRLSEQHRAIGRRRVAELRRSLHQVA